MRLFTFILISFILFFLMGCENRSSDIDGQWKRFDTVWKFENGTAYINGTEYEFYTDSERLFLKNGEKHREIPYFISGDTLEINGFKFNRLADENAPKNNLPFS